MKVAVILPAAGLGTRMGKSTAALAGTSRKQFMLLEGSPILVHTVRKFLASDRVGVIVGGKLRGVGAPDEIVGVQSHGMEILFECDGSDKIRLLLDKAAKTGKRYRLQVPEGDLYTAMQQLGAAQAKILSVTQVRATLEEYFMHLVEAGRAQAAAVEVSGK